MEASPPIDVRAPSVAGGTSTRSASIRTALCDFTARKLSDFVTRTQLHALEIYAEFFRPFDVEYELDVGLPAPPTHTEVFLFSRQSRDFTER